MKLKVTQIRSIIGRKKKQRANVKGLGLKGINKTVEIKDNLENRGMLRKVKKIVQIKGEK
ncbi:50S ribosomal protein L30 [Candidatus Portiera aleyrodidarum]|uniref:50S ribosomal protein L30 n=1 Tax=Candidatus Portiera aleyrodidarum TaxID=91844 RepID=UPI0005D82B2E|nr:50S ribosomal protein L30 [Candidatus Portiera aleyrodidarum]CEL12375.1 50S ribosomal protein L30 [Candidatus Portiera aleyrodidarum]